MTSFLESCNLILLLSSCVIMVTSITDSCHFYMTHHFSYFSSELWLAYFRDSNFQKTDMTYFSPSRFQFIIFYSMLACFNTLMECVFIRMNVHVLYCHKMRVLKLGTLHLLYFRVIS